jgi:hypothetical protein
VAGSKSSGPQSAAEGLGNVLRAITDTMQAPDAVRIAGPLMHLQTTVLDMIHAKVDQQGGQQQHAPGQPGQPGAPGAAPPGAAPPSAPPLAVHRRPLAAD